MPSTSKKQAKFMAAAAHNPEFAKKAGISMDVAKEFNKADTGTRVDLQKVAKPKTDHGKSKLFKKGGEMKHEDIKLDKKIVKKAVSMHDKQLHGGKKTNLAALKKGGKTCMARGGGVEIKGKTKGTMIKMCTGGMKGKAK